MQQQNIESEDTHMEDGTAEEERKSSHLSESSNQNVRTFKQTDWVPKEDKQKYVHKKGDNITKNKNGHRGTTKE